MSSLTEQERLGLDEVFLSISSGRGKRRKWFSIRKFLQKLAVQERVGIKQFKPVKILFNVQKRLKTYGFFYKLPEKRKKKRKLRK